MTQPLVLSRDQVRRVDEIAIRQFGIPGMVLMENAGRGCVEVMCRHTVGPVLVLCGAGNNAGDGFVIARHLAVRGMAAECALAAPPERLTGDAALNFQILDRLNLPWFLADDSHPSGRLEKGLQQATWIVDALLGTGAVGPPRPALARLIDLANAAEALRFAVDLPSGLDCDTGQAAMPTFRAQHTGTFVAAKPGLLLATARDYVGQLHILDIGLPPSAIEGVRSGS